MTAKQGNNSDRMSVSESKPVEETAIAGKLGNAVSFLDVDETVAGQRIDNFLIAHLKGVPKSRIYRLLRKGEVRVNKGRVKPEYRVVAGDQIRVPPVRLGEKSPVPVPGVGLRRHLDASALCESDSFLVVNKPSGLAVHGGSGVDLGLIEAMRQCRPEERFLELVHRLDKETSGCLLLAKKRSALRHLQQQLRDGIVEKQYIALAAGDWPKGITSIDAPLRKDTLVSGERVVRAVRDGKRAVTHFQVLRRFGFATLLAVRLETGRTHQIRVHTRIAGHSLAGDDKYGDPGFNDLMAGYGLKRLFLHAAELGFSDPDASKRLTVAAPLAPELEQVLKRLEAQA